MKISSKIKTAELILYDSWIFKMIFPMVVIIPKFYPSSKLIFTYVAFIYLLITLIIYINNIYIFTKEEKENDSYRKQLFYKIIKLLIALIIVGGIIWYEYFVLKMVDFK